MQHQFMKPDMPQFLTVATDFSILFGTKWVFWAELSFFGEIDFI